jgi:uncharacterized protein YndB with AHSA1/START domain
MTGKGFIAPKGKPEVTITGVFDAPPERVFNTYTDPRLIPQWWGPERLTTIVDRLDASKGGIWRFVQRDAGGKVYAFNGVYHEVLPPHRLVFTFEYEGSPGGVLLETVTLKAQDGKTILTDKSVFQSVEGRDAMLAEGMEEGSIEGMERLAKLLQTSSKSPPCFSSGDDLKESGGGGLEVLR